MRKKIRNYIIILLLLLFLGTAYINKERIQTFIVRNYMINSLTTTDYSNTYSKNINYISFQKTDNFVPKNKEELKNIIYTILDNGWDNYSFYCDNNYSNYVDDIKEMSDSGLFDAMNNYIHPYNSFKNLNISVNNYGIITVTIVKNYNVQEIKAINEKINSIINEIITKNMTTKEKIKAFHDYIVNHTEYDSEEAQLVENNETNNLVSFKAYNVLINGLGLCGGYTDTLAIFLNKLGINNFKVSTAKHIWNAIYIDNNWYHIDMTWDDPVTNGEPKLIYDYFIIPTSKLKELDQTKHNYDINKYLELK